MQYSKSWNKGVNILDIENIWSLPFNIPAAIAFYKTIKSIRIKVITHHHDFFWGRFHYSSPTRQTIKDLLCTYFPPRDNQKKIELLMVTMLLFTPCLIGQIELI